MSWRASGYVKGVTICPNGQRITRTEKFVALILADYYNDETANCWVSVASLCDDGLLSERHCRRVLRSLEDKKLIQSKIGGPGQVSIYSFPEMARSIARGKQKHGDTMAPSKPVDNSQNMGTPWPQDGDTMAPHMGTFRVKHGDIAVSPKQEETVRTKKKSGPSGPVLVDNSKADDRRPTTDDRGPTAVCGPRSAVVLPPASKRRSGIPEAIAAAADPIYNSDPDRFKTLVAWIKQKISGGYPEPVIVAALGEFRERMANVEGEWWPYLDAIVKRARTTYLQVEAETYKKPGPIKLGDLPGLAKLAGMANQTTEDRGPTSVSGLPSSVVKATDAR